MSSASPTPSPSSITPTTSPKLLSTHHRGSRRPPLSSDGEAESFASSNPSFHVISTAQSDMSAATMPAASMATAAGGSTSTATNGSTSSMGISGLDNNARAGISVLGNNDVSSKNPSSSRSPPYYNDVAIGKSTGARAPPLTLGENKERAGHRKRSSSLVTVEKIEQSHEELLDQSAGFNANADWVNYKGAWVIHVVLILLGKILVDVIPGMEQDTGWTIVNLGYIAVSYLMFHYVTGTPFESNAGAYDELTLWEQIDEGAQYTPAKKWLTSVPIGLFLISTHYTRYNPWLFSLNFFALLFVLFPKLPILHRLRFKVAPLSSQRGSLPPTPTPSRPTSAASFR